MERNAQQMAEVGEMLRGLAQRAEAAAEVPPDTQPDATAETSEALADALDRLAAAQAAMMERLTGAREEEHAAAERVAERIAESHERLLGALEKDRIETDARERHALDRLVAGQERLLAALERDHAPAGGGMDEETRQRIRSLDVQVLRVLEELTAGRQEAVGDLRAELRNLAKAIASTADRPR